MLFVASFASARSGSLQEPGCLSLVQGKAISDDAAKFLPKRCQEFREAYLDGLERLAHTPQKFENGLKDSIASAKGHRSPYTALVLAVLSRSPEQNKVLLPALEKRAALESKLKVAHPYAKAAFERLKTGECASFKSAVYDELCRAHDAVYERVAAINESEAKRK